MKFSEFLEESTKPYELVAVNMLAKISLSILRQRDSSGLTQQELAAKMDISQGMLSRWESGEYNFSVRQLCKIAYLLDMDIEVSLKGKQKTDNWTLQTYSAESVDVQIPEFILQHLIS